MQSRILLSVMKRTTLLFLLLLCFVIPIYSEHGYNGYKYSRSTLHHIGIVGGVGYSANFDNYQEISTIGNVGGTIGLEYEFRLLNGFWLSIGPEIQFLSGSSHFKTTGTDIKVIDTYGVEANYHYNFDNGTDIQRNVYVNLPITLGYYVNGWYFGAGVKVGYGIYSSESTHLRYTTTGTYREYIDDFKQMSGHFYSSYETSCTLKMPLKFKVSVIGEVGYDVLSWYKDQYHSIQSGLKISLFAEYGLNNLNIGGKDVPLYTIDQINPSVIHLQPFYASRDGASHIIHPFYAGVKVTWTFCIKTKNCNCEENWQYFNSRYKNMVR